MATIENQLDIESRILRFNFETALQQVIQSSHGINSKGIVRIRRRFLLCGSGLDFVKQRSQNSLANQLVGDGSFGKQLTVVLFDKVGVHIPFDEFLVSRELHQEINVGIQTDNVVLGKAGSKLAQGTGPILAPHHQFGNHRIVVDRYFVSLTHT